jgi:hypothetical protein
MTEVNHFCARDLVDFALGFNRPTGSIKNPMLGFFMCVRKMKNCRKNENASWQCRTL